ncbi:MAG: hypothetical protein IPP38_12310 [Bacteroidetes bacterium]|nr:hypothetical protein [Bacteroidota bacterium]
MPLCPNRPIKKELLNLISRQLLSLSTGIIAAFFFIVYNKKNDISTIENIFVLLANTLFGLSILFIILAMKWNASKYYFLGCINDSLKQNDRAKNERIKNTFNCKLQIAKNAARVFFLLGSLTAISFLAIYMSS